MSIKSTIAALAASPFLLAGAAFAGPYVNVESNLSYPDGDYSSGTTDLHVGYEGGEGDLGFYVQAGPAFVHTDSTDDTETEISGKAGVTYAVNEDLGLYGEIAGISNGEDSSGDDIVDWSGKIGAKFTF
jgi:outer membrane autotransporter protein|tara:strand:+ start:217 stop:603 length:387 start_codon:yes stop_codon:yes gene_type:complete